MGSKGRGAPFHSFSSPNKKVTNLKTGAIFKFYQQDINAYQSNKRSDNAFRKLFVLRKK